MTAPDRQALMAAITRVKQSLERIYENCSQKGKTDNDYLQQAIGVSHALDLLGGSEITAALAEAAPAGTVTEYGELIDKALKEAEVGGGSRRHQDWLRALATAIETVTRERDEWKDAARFEATRGADMMVRRIKAEHALEAAESTITRLTKERDERVREVAYLGRCLAERNSTIAELRAQLEARPTTASGLVPMA